MTEVNETQIDKLEEEVIVEEVIEKEPEPEYEKFLKAPQVDALKKARLVSKESIRAASDEDLVKVKGIGLNTIVKLREWAVGEVKKGDAVSMRHLIFADSKGEPIEIKPGDVITAVQGAEEYVKKGKARWQ